MHLIVVGLMVMRNLMEVRSFRGTTHFINRHINCVAYHTCCCCTDLYGDDDLDLSTQLAINIDSQTDSTHDTPLTVCCTGGHDELVQVLLARGADLEHRDKKG